MEFIILCDVKLAESAFNADTAFETGWYSPRVRAKAAASPKWEMTYGELFSFVVEEGECGRFASGIRFAVFVDELDTNGDYGGADALEAVRNRQ